MLPAMSITLVLPPLTQLNTPYPSISYLAQSLLEKGIPCKQRDLGIELVLKVFSREGLTAIFSQLEELEELPQPAWRALSLAQEHIAVIDSVVAFLQGRDTSLAARILEGGLLPAGPRIQRIDLQSFGIMGTHDAARHMATLYLADLSDLISSCIDEGFALAKYQAHLATSATSFDPLWERLSQTTLIDHYLDELCDELDGDIVGLSVPFPGNLYGALRIGKSLKARGIYVVMGGGYINTELRDIDEPRIWECIDALTYDDGEGPLDAILQFRSGKGDKRHRTKTAAGEHKAEVERPRASFAPFYGDLKLDQYLQTIDTLNPAHRLWADGRWNKLTLAHGCYWKRCTFCDVNLDYISHYDGSPIVALVDHMERLIEETGQRGFHFVDEAAPPKLLRNLALEILRRDLRISMWGNIRFEKSYNTDLCKLLAKAGLIAVTGGLEVANERLLKKIDKGVSIPQVVHATSAFQEAGIMVHAYLMYGFPSQTVQESIDSMELVRQLFAAGLINSGFWHRFVLTRHAPIFKTPEQFGVELIPLKTRSFAQNDVPHRDSQEKNHDRFDAVLPLALEAWLQGRELGKPVHRWFPRNLAMPPTGEVPHRIADILDEANGSSSSGKRGATKPSSLQGRVLWLGGHALEFEGGITLHTVDGELTVEGKQDEIDWLGQVLEMSRIEEEPLLLRDAISSFPGKWKSFQTRWKDLRELGLLIV